MKRIGRRTCVLVRKIGAADDETHATERCIRHPVRLHEHLERAALAAMTESRATYVERSLGHAAHVFGPRHEDECRCRVHKASDRPSGRDAIDMKDCPSDVAHRLYRSRRRRASSMARRAGPRPLALK